MGEKDVGEQGERQKERERELKKEKKTGIQGDNTVEETDEGIKAGTQTSQDNNTRMNNKKREIQCWVCRIGGGCSCLYIYIYIYIYIYMYI